MRPSTRTCLLAIATLALITGCDTATKPTPPRPTNQPGPTDPTGSTGGNPSPRLIRCVSGEAHLTAPIAHTPDEVAVGPLSWAGLRGWATADPTGYGRQDAEGGHYKIGAGLRAGSTVTVAVPAEARGYAGLEYGQSFGYRSTAAVTFQACPDSDTSFIGGFFVKEHRCVPLDVTVGQAPPVRIVISFFAGPCPP